MTGLTGTPPYNVEICNIYGQNCIPYAQIISPVPTSVIISLTSQFDLAPSVVVKITDSNDCLMEKIVYCDGMVLPSLP